MLSLALLPLLSLACLIVLFFSTLQISGLYTRLRLSIVAGFLAQSLYIVLVTEFLSAFHWISRIPLIITWGCLDLALIFVLWHKRRLRNSFEEVFSALGKAISGSRIIQIVLAFLAVSLLLALIYPPNNFDSMVYHLARVAHWIQNHSISHYQTNILRQLYSGPFAEWIILHLQLLTGSDRLDNTVQLGFFAGCMIVASLVTKQLGGGYRQQGVTILLVCLIPMAIIESNTTQNDIIVAFFVLSFVYFTIRIAQQAKGLLLYSAAGISLGLAFLTKGTAFFFTVPFCLWYLIQPIREIRRPFKQLLKRIAVYIFIPLIALLINSGHFYRNLFLFGNLDGSASHTLGNEAYSPKAIGVVAVKNFMNHMPVTPEIKTLFSQQVSKMGLDPDDPRYSYNTLDWMITGFSFHEDYAQNLVHALLILFITIFFFTRKRFYNEPLNYYSLFFLTLLFASFLFCLLLKWQPWSNRLETSLFMLYCIPIAIILCQLKKWLLSLSLSITFCFGVAASLLNTNHPILPITESIFFKSYNSFLLEPKGLPACKRYLDSTRFQNIGLLIGNNSWDYPFYKVLLDDNSKRVLKHVLVRNESSIYLDNFVPDIILSLNTDVESFSYEHKTYYKTKEFKGGPAIFEPR